MNSTMMKENTVQFLKSLEKPARRTLLRQGLLYTEASKTGDSQKIRSAYESFLAAIQEGEQITGIQLITSPDDSFLCALNAFAAFLQTLVNTVNTVSFHSLQQANDWLKDKTNLILTGVQIETRTSLGLFANHSNASKITISYRAGTGDHLYQYGICQHEKTHLFWKHKAEGFAQQWEAENPGLECISVQHTRNSRGSISSMLFGFGPDYIEHVKHFITYRKPISAA